jgi:hypothetical protein
MDLTSQCRRFEASPGVGRGALRRRVFRGRVIVISNETIARFWLDGKSSREFERTTAKFD